MTDKVRIGVFICDCDGQIAGPLDLDEIDRKLSGLEDVVLTQQIPYGCSPYGEEAIRQGIRNSELDRVVLLGCSPRIMEKRFQTVCADAGLNPALLEIVNLRDQWAWVRKNGADHGDGKAWDLVKSGLAKARHLTPVKTITSRIHPNVAVIGGGIAGMTSALSLADRGISVTLLEKRTEITGNQAQDVRKSKHIDLLMGAEPVTVSGSYGNYEIKVKVGRRTRKVRCGAVILAMGAEEFRPHGLYGYGENDRVMTQSGLRHRLEEDPTAAAGVNHVVMIQCVGALTEERPYCGRICCLATVQNAIQLKVKNPSLSVTILYRHMVSDPGPDRSMLDRCYDLGIKFLRISQDSPPRVAPATVMGKTAEGKSFRLPYDWVVLSTPLVACDSSRHLAQAFRIPVDQFGFIPDTLPNLKPHQVTEPCVRVVGSAHWPCTSEEAAYQGYGGAARIASLVERGEVSSIRHTATVNFDACRGCGTCLEWCPFDVPVIAPLNGGNLVSYIDPFLCKGCGSCVVHCPTGAATIQNQDDETYRSVIEAALSTREAGSVKTIAFLCDWSGYAAADLAGTRRRSLPPEVIPIRIPCAGRVSTGLILHAFLSGADGVLVCACEEGDCHYLSGNHNCAAVEGETQNILGLLGFERTRLQMANVSPVDFESFARILEEFVSRISQLQPAVTAIE